MFEKDLASTLRSMSVEDFNGLEGLSRMIVEKSSKELKEIVRFHHREGMLDQRKARTVLLGAGDVALPPLLASLDPRDADRYVWDVETCVDLHAGHRAKLAAVLGGMLDDKRELMTPEISPTEEERPARRRVCDAAYLQLRRLLSFEESEPDLFLNSVLYLQMDDERRDAEIARARTSRRWISLAEEA